MFLLDTYHRRLYAYAITLVDDRALAQDIVQNVFLKTWKFRKKLNKKFSIQSFLYKSVYNEFVNTHKQDQAMRSLQLKYYESLSQIVESTDESMINRFIDIVTKEIEKLPPKCRQVFILSKKEGLTNLEISEHLNVSIKTVEAQITKAIKILRKELDDQYELLLILIFGSIPKYSKLLRSS